MNAARWIWASAGVILLAVGLTQGAPVPSQRVPPRGIAVVTETNTLLYLDESGQLIRQIDLRRLVGKSWVPVALSPSGARIALLDRSAGALRPEGGRIQAASLTGGMSSAEFPEETPADDEFVFSPDGKSLIGTRLVVDGAFGLGSHTRNIRFDLTAGKWADLLIQPTARADKNYPVTTHSVLDWSADGDWFLTKKLDGVACTGQLFVVSRDGNTARELTSADSAVFEARFSPDGRAVLFSERDRLCCLKLPDGKPVRVDDHKPSARVTLVRFAWRPDGRRIAYLACRKKDGSDRDYEWDLVTSDPDGSHAKTIRTSRNANWRSSQLLGWK
ncbi:MAG: translocation protein TolB [Gemmataceae bacterium]|nr:translocation protein TolB [Gemmataceae bacterium]